MLAMPTPDTIHLPDIKDLLKPVQPHLVALNFYLNEEVNAFEPEVREFARYCLRHTGKQLRPTLVFYSGWQDAISAPNPQLVRVAAILELVHQATLVHDDILDGASIRHNSPTLNEEYNAHTAVLLGDILFSHALKLASDFPTVTVCRAVSQATRRVCAGEIGQTFQHRSPKVSLVDYYRIIDLKTAELFRVSCELGAEIAGYPADFVKAAAVFGRHLGIAYQIFDDLADITGKEATIGKTLGTDLQGGKFTLPILLLLEKLEVMQRQTLVEEMQSGRANTAKWANPIREYGIPALVKNAFFDEIAKAESALLPYREFPPFKQLMSLSSFIKYQTETIRV